MALWWIRACATGRPASAAIGSLLSVILDNLAANVPPEKILRSHLTQRPQDVQAAMAYATDLRREG
jgi:uncharacterized protein (DUF433 family)